MNTSSHLHRGRVVLFMYVSVANITQEHTHAQPSRRNIIKKLKPPTSLMSVETVFPDHQLNQSMVKWKLQTSEHFPKATSCFLSVSQLTYKEKTPPTLMFFLQHTQNVRQSSEGETAHFLGLELLSIQSKES